MEDMVGEGRSHERSCRFCGARLDQSFADLGMSPLANSYIKPEQINRMEPFYPLHAYVCGSCFLVQLEEFESPQHIFSDYAYFSSYSESLLQHSRKYTAEVVERFDIGPTWKIIEIASNDGYLLQYFKERGIPVLGIEPAANIAKVAAAKGIDCVVKFFGVNTAEQVSITHHQANLIIGNNVLAHVPDLNDFVGGLKILLARNGIITMEFPHLMRLMERNQFDTIYHEHFSYFSLITVEKVFKSHGLDIFDVEELSTLGGSLRVFVKHADDDTKEATDRLVDLRQREIDAGFMDLKIYREFAASVKETKRRLLDFVIKAKREGKSIVGYGAPAKGATLLNYCGIRTDFIDYTVDISPHKAGAYLPGVHVPIHTPNKLKETKPDYVLILVWNLKDEIMNQVSYINEWGGRFVIPIPEITVH
jgi:2-polyprenyl-3-methyl-5-hydroxy-6-metoxy-1,4-benzoquinol methylase